MNVLLHCCQPLLAEEGPQLIMLPAKQRSRVLEVAHNPLDVWGAITSSDKHADRCARW